MSVLANICRRHLAKGLESTLAEGTGRIVIRSDGKEVITAGSGDDVGEIDVRDEHAFVAFARGSITSGESYMAGEWDSPDLAKLLTVICRNIERYGHRLGSNTYKRFLKVASMVSFLSRKSRDRARRNIASHYDLGNDMFGMFLDDERMYSCAMYPSDDASLTEAQRNKLEVLCRKGGVVEGSRVLDLGCGWGALSVWAARKHGARVVALTLSKEQHAYVTERVRKEGLGDRIEVVLSDYRDLDPGEGFDSVISVEMIEAVGPHNFGAYFSEVARMLKKGGRAVIQAITNPEHLYEEALFDIDFVKKYIFPGGACPSREVMDEKATDAGLKPGEVEDITEHYVRTLVEWRERFVANIDKIKEMGYSNSFCRMMIFYFASCEAGFATRIIEDIQAEYLKPA